MINQIGIRIEAVRVGYFYNEEFSKLPPPVPELAWIVVSLRPYGKGWVTVWNAVERQTLAPQDDVDHVSPIWAAIALGRNLSIALGCPIIEPEF